MLGNNKMNFFTFKRKDEDDQKKKINKKKLTRLLITINVSGSAGPLRLLVNEDDLVSNVIQMALKSYARQERLPLLGFDAKDFLLYCPRKLDVEAYVLAGLSPMEAIGCCGGREFTMIKENTNVGLKNDSPKQKLPKWKSCFVIRPKSVLAS